MLRLSYILTEGLVHEISGENDNFGRQVRLSFPLPCTIYIWSFLKMFKLLKNLTCKYWKDTVVQDWKKYIGYDIDQFDSTLSSQSETYLGSCQTSMITHAMIECFCENSSRFLAVNSYRKKFYHSCLIGS